MSSGALFVVCIPTEVAERKLMNGDSGENEDATTKTTTTTQNIRQRNVSKTNTILDGTDTTVSTDICEPLLPASAGNKSSQLNVQNIFAARSPTLLAATDDAGDPNTTTVCVGMFLLLVFC